MTGEFKEVAKKIKEMTTNKICGDCGHDEIKHEGKYGCFDDIIYNKKSCDCKKFKPAREELSR